MSCGLLLMLCPPSTRALSFLVPPSPLRLLAVFPLELIGRFPVFFFMPFLPNIIVFSSRFTLLFRNWFCSKFILCFIFMERLKMALTGFRPIYRFLSRLYF